MTIIQIIFWILLGLLYLGVHFQFQEILIGVCALIIGLAQIAGLVQQQQQ